jgi:regulator of nucleoside diphosphate kinase
LAKPNQEIDDMNPTPIITELDAARIQDLANRLPDAGSGFEDYMQLLSKINHEAEIVPGRRISPDIVTVNSTVTFRDEVVGSEHRVTLVYPAEASMSMRRISVLSPVGRALLGQPVGSVASFELPDGNMREIRILELNYQPEAAGEFAR